MEPASIKTIIESYFDRFIFSLDLKDGNFIVASDSLI